MERGRHSPLLYGDEGTQGSPRLEIWQTIRRQNEDKVKYPPRSCGKGLQTTPLHTGEDAVVAEERGVQMRGEGANKNNVGRCSTISSNPTTKTEQKRKKTT